MRRLSAALPALLVVLSPLVVTFTAVAQSSAPATPVTAPKVREVIDILQSRKLEAFAAKDPSGQGKYVGVLHVPGAQLLVVAARHGRASDVEYYLYKKDFMSAYMDLNSSVLATEKVFIEDALGDGLVALPGKSLGRDSCTRDGKQLVFDGEFADPRKRNDKRMPQAEYDRGFAEAEAEYTRLLDLLLAELKKAPAHFPAEGLMR